VKRFWLVVASAMFVLVGCSSGPSDEEAALEYAYGACVNYYASGGAGDAETFEQLDYWKSWNGLVSDSLSSANKARALDPVWDGLANTLTELSIVQKDAIGTWQSTAPGETLSDASDVDIRPIPDLLIRLEQDCSRVDDVIALNGSTDRSQSGDSLSLEAQGLLAVLLGVASLATYMAVVWFVWWMAGRKNRNQATYLVLAIIFPLVMIIAVVLQRKLPDPEPVGDGSTVTPSMDGGSVDSPSDE